MRSLPEHSGAYRCLPCLSCQGCLPKTSITCVSLCIVWLIKVKLLLNRRLQTIDSPKLSAAILRKELKCSSVNCSGKRTQRGGITARYASSGNKIYISLLYKEYLTFCLIGRKLMVNFDAFCDEQMVTSKFGS